METEEEDLEKRKVATEQETLKKRKTLKELQKGGIYP